MPIEIKHLDHIYMPGSPFETKALDDVTLTIGDGEFVGLIGHTGSGKSTLVQHLNGLMKPDHGSVIVDGMDVSDKNTDLREIRRRVGLVFQYPEHQLFEETVRKDVSFGPRNLGCSEQEIEERVVKACHQVGLSDEKLDMSPFDLSGGNKRRVAIAGVLAMRPRVLVLDEPTAGLDPRGRNELLELIRGLHDEEGNTIVMVSHSMDDISALAQRIIVMNEGRVAMDGTPREVFAHPQELVDMHLGVPAAAQLAMELRKRGYNLPDNVYTLDEMRSLILAMPDRAHA
ncbi:MAG: energy-coupling factor transporter ATPase [Candidatus Fimadaptatus sp.]|nr:energy-coupling factor transporter ATPase [Candidatus Fimadaptatus sp.]